MMQRTAMRTLCLIVATLFFSAEAHSHHPDNPPPSSGVERHYFIAAEEVTWNYAPLGRDGATGILFNDTMNEKPHTGIGMSESPSMWTVSSTQRIGRLYKKALFREYTDATFTIVKGRATEWEHLGYLGPVLRAEVGDTLKITFKNNARNPYSMHPHGVFYTKENEGVPTPMESVDHDMMMNDGNKVMPGMQWVYTWEVPERAGPGPSDPSSIVWMYHSHVDETFDTNSGLVGPIIVTRRGRADSLGKPTDVDREFVIMFTILDENQSWYLDDNILSYLPNNGSVDEMIKSHPEFMMSNQKHTVNGYVFANLMGVNMTVNETVRWYVIALGNELDIHGSHWHGQTLLYNGNRVDVVELIPASMKTLDMIPDNPGMWLLHCHTNHHIIAGMTAMFNVQPCTTPCARVGEVSPALKSTPYYWSVLLSFVFATFVAKIFC